jgi:hypothetical protein
MGGMLDTSDVMCQNQMSGPTVIAADAKRNYEIIFQGKGHPDGEDVQAIPEYLMHTIQFKNAIRKGILLVIEGEDHPVVVAAMRRQTDTFQKRLAADNLAAREVIDAAADNDIVIVNCIGPGSRDGAVCGEQVPLKDKDQASRPPLCDRHQHLADFCIKRGNQPWLLERQEGLF